MNKISTVPSAVTDAWFKNKRSTAKSKMGPTAKLNRFSPPKVRPALSIKGWYTRKARRRAAKIQKLCERKIIRYPVPDLKRREIAIKSEECSFILSAAAPVGASLATFDAY
jgi:hypothetical protein